MLQISNFCHFHTVLLIADNQKVASQTKYSSKVLFGEKQQKENWNQRAEKKLLKGLLQPLIASFSTHQKQPQVIEQP